MTVLAAEDAPGRGTVTDKVTDRVTDRPTDKVTDRPSDRVTDRPTDKVADRVTDRPADRPIDRCLNSADEARRAVTDHRSELSDRIDAVVAELDRRENLVDEGTGDPVEEVAETDDGNQFDSGAATDRHSTTTTVERTTSTEGHDRQRDGWTKRDRCRIVGSMRQIQHWIDGSLAAGASSRVGPVFNPATGEQTGQVALANTDDVDAAVRSAREAFESWRYSSLTKRQNIMFAFREIMSDRRQEMAETLTSEHGKTVDDAVGEVQRGIEVVEFACNIAHLLKGDYSEQVSAGVDTYTIRQPLGVVAGITPFNFPAMVPMWMYPIAIACGNTFILKPSEKDPSTSLLAAEMLADAGLPDGVFNVVHGDKESVDALIAHPDVAAISFVGSTPIARYIYETGTQNGKRVQALGGAKNHMIVLPDADIDLAADAAVSAGYGSAGERCMAISAVVAVGEAGDPLIEGVQTRIEKLTVGPGDRPGVEMGPLVTSQHLDRVRGYVDAGERQGALLVADGRDFVVDGYENGYFLGPTLFDNVTTDMSIYTDEIFGPVLSTVRMEHFEEAIQLINENPYGNGTAVFTNDGGAARKFQNEIQVGMVGINVPIPVPLSFYSFGGWKDSIFGSHAIYGPEGVHFYTRQKVVISRWPDPIHRGVDLGFPTHG
jgi:malonate-semialdehyde dehydrogenase (acetylating)/methylmalonate-semialdehyde dehydrogenase